MTTDDRRDDAWSERLSEFVDRELSHDEMTAMSRHVEGCASCRTAAAELARVRDRLATRPVVPLAEIWSAVLPRLESRDSRLRGGPEARPSPVPHARRRAFVGGLAAAAILLTLVGGVWLGASVSRKGVAPFGWAIPGLPMPQRAIRGGPQDVTVTDPAARAVLWKVVDDIDHAVIVMNRRAASDSGNAALLDSIARLRDERAALRRLLTGTAAGTSGRKSPESPQDP